MLFSKYRLYKKNKGIDIVTKSFSVVSSEGSKKYGTMVHVWSKSILIEKDILSMAFSM